MGTRACLLSLTDEIGLTRSLSQLDIVSLVVEVLVPHFILDLDESRKRLFEDSMNGPTPDVPIQDIFALYRRTKTLMAMHNAFVPK